MLLCLKLRMQIKIDDKIPYGWKGCMVTILTQNRVNYFGEIENNEMRYSKAGIIAGIIWNDIANCRQNLQRNRFVIMPDHMHGILLYKDITTFDEFNERNQIISISNLIASYKSTVKKYCNKYNIEFLWHNGYHEQSIKSDSDFINKINYVNNNVKNWSK